jgi:hypothetical protein
MKNTPASPGKESLLAGKLAIEVIWALETAFEVSHPLSWE